MIAEPIERRSSKRFDVNADHAEIVVEFDGMDHRAVMSDVSATGFGLLLLKGSRITPGTAVQLTDAESQTTFDLEVVHVRPEESFQYVGLRRVSDATQHSIPLFRLCGKTYRLPIPSVSPLIFFGFIIGFSGTSISLVELIRNADGEDKQTKNSVHEQALIDASNRISPAEKRRRLLARSRGRGTGQPATQSWLEITPNFWERITGPSREQVRRLVGDRKISWSELITRLNLSSEQQDRIHGLLNSNDDGEAQATRTKMMSILTGDQRSVFNQLLATLPVN